MSVVSHFSNLCLLCFNISLFFRYHFSPRTRLMNDVFLEDVRVQLCAQDFSVPRPLRAVIAPICAKDLSVRRSARFPLAPELEHDGFGGNWWQDREARAAAQQAKSERVARHYADRQREKEEREKAAAR